MVIRPVVSEILGKEWYHPPPSQMLLHCQKEQMLSTVKVAVTSLKNIEFGYEFVRIFVIWNYRRVKIWYSNLPKNYMEQDYTSVNKMPEKVF